MTGKQIAWHFVRLGLAAALLAFDTRVFLFYAFTLLLGLGWQVERLRAIVRILSMRSDAKLLALLTERGLGESDVLKATDKILTELTDEQREDFERDALRSLGKPIV